MAQGSGPAALVPPPPGVFGHQPSGIRYAVFARDGQSWISFDRRAGSAPGAQLPEAPVAAGHPGISSSTAREPLHGEHPLAYYIGSGKHGRTYLYQVDGIWFELPINYYTRRDAWDMAPAFDNATSMPSDLPTDPGCLHCHATGVAEALPGSRSHYAAAPFAQGGIGCSACHGDATAHLAANGHAPITNPGKLSPTRRDSACLACHLEGDSVVFRPGKMLARFQPGEDLSDTAIYYVRASRSGGGGRAASQYEALLRSACKRAAGDRLTCTSCHDPHASPTAAERVAFYRNKCLACHTSPVLATTHHPEQPDCASCHMPTRSTTDISHEQTVDHDIERLPATTTASTPRTGETLLPVGNWHDSDRELGLAYAQMAEHGDHAAAERALRLLGRAEAAEAPGAADPTLHARFGFLLQISGDRTSARSEYQAALRQNPDEPSALSNLAVLEATAGHPQQALILLERLIANDPTQTSAGLNLAFIACRLNDQARAAETLVTLARYNPDDPALAAFRTTGNYAGQHCAVPRPAPHE